MDVGEQHFEYVTRWEMIFEILSLERVEPFLPAMGLRFPKADVLRSLSRQFLKQLEHLRGDMEGEKSLLQRVFTDIAKVTDKPTSEKLHRWGMEEVSFGKQKGLFRWALLLRWLAGLGSTHLPVTPPALDQARVELIVQTVREEFGDELILEQRLEEADQLPRSPWEERIYRGHEAGSSPMHLVSGTIENHRTRRVWEFIKTLLTSDEIKEFLQWAKVQAPSLNLDPQSLEIPS